MSLSISPQIKVVALMGVLLIALAGAYKYVLHHKADEPIVIPPVHHTKPAPTTHQKPAQTRTGKHHQAAPARAGSAGAAAVAGVRNAARPAHPNRVNPLLPAPVRAALAEHRIVVVSLWDPKAAVDQLSVAEARAGASNAAAGFAVVNVLDNKVAGPLTALLPKGDMLPDPGVLVYRAPGKLVYRFDGYLDAAAVAQAATNAEAGLDTAPAAESPLP